MKWITVLGLTALIAGCASSPPSRFYSLTAVTPESPLRAGRTPSRAAVQVGAVHLPPTLDREEIVRRGPRNRLEISGLDRWGAPLDEMVQRVLTEDLLERLPAGQVVLPGSPAPARTGRIIVDVLQFQSDVDGAVVFEGSWSLLEPGSGAPSLTRDIRYTETANPSDYGDQARVLSVMLGRLADDIVQRLPDT